MTESNRLYKMCFFNSVCLKNTEYRTFPLSHQKHHVQLIVSLIKLICFGIYKQFSQDRHTSHQEIGPRAELTLGLQEIDLNRVL